MTPPPTPPLFFYFFFYFFLFFFIFIFFFLFIFFFICVTTPIGPTCHACPFPDTPSVSLSHLPLFSPFSPSLFLSLLLSPTKLAHWTHVHCPLTSGVTHYHSTEVRVRNVCDSTSQSTNHVPTLNFITPPFSYYSMLPLPLPTYHQVMFLILCHWPFSLSLAQRLFPPVSIALVSILSTSVAD